MGEWLHPAPWGCLVTLQRLCRSFLCCAGAAPRKDVPEGAHSAGAQWVLLELKGPIGKGQQWTGIPSQHHQRYLETCQKYLFSGLRLWAAAGPVVTWSWLLPALRADGAHLPTRSSATVGSLDSAVGGSTDTTEIGRSHESGLFFSTASELLNSYRHNHGWAGPSHPCFNKPSGRFCLS